MNYFYLGTSKEEMDYFQSQWTGGMYGAISGLQGVILHDSASGMNATAASVASYTANNMKVTTSASNYHNVVDHNGRCQAVCNEKYATYSLGDKNMNDTYYPNDHFISIEIAPSLTGGDFASQADKDKYHKAWQNACKLVADYCVKYNLSTNQVHQHREYGSTSCPYTMMKYFGSYEKALSMTRSEVSKNIKIIKGETMEQKPGIYYSENTHLGSKYKHKEGIEYRRIVFNCTKDIYLCEGGKSDQQFKKGDAQVGYKVTRNGCPTLTFCSNGVWKWAKYAEKGAE